MAKYLRKRFGNKIIEFKSSLNKDNFKIGTTYEDYINDKWVSITKRQEKFLKDNPGASINEIIKCKIDPLRLKSDIQIVKDSKIKEINDFDRSENINEFFINEKSYWIDKEERSILLSRVQTDEKNGRDFTIFWISGEKIELTISDAYNILYGVEDYAIQCFDKTQENINIVLGLNTKEEILVFDYKVGYPDKKHFNVVC